MMRREVYPRCQQTVHLRHIATSPIIHCVNHYYKQVRGRRRIRKMCKFTISPFYIFTILFNHFIQSQSLLGIEEVPFY